MNAKDIIQQVYAKVNGEYEDVAIGSEDYNTYLNSINRKIMDWAYEEGVNWNSLFDPEHYLEGVVEESKEYYPVGDILNPQQSIYGYIYFEKDGEEVAKYQLVQPTRFEGNYEPQTATLTARGLRLHIPTDEAIIGARIRLPAYLRPIPMSKPTDVPQIDSVPWLIIASAADMCDASPVPFIARNAKSFREDANRIMIKLKQNNRIQQKKIQDDRNPYGHRHNFDARRGF